MREENRIKRILEKIEKLWLLAPDQRFYQMCINHGLVVDDIHFWRLEDDVIEKHLDNQLKKYERVEKKLRTKNKKLSAKH